MRPAVFKVQPERSLPSQPVVLNFDIADRKEIYANEHTCMSPHLKLLFGLKERNFNRAVFNNAPLMYERLRVQPTLPSRTVPGVIPHTDPATFTSQQPASANHVEVLASITNECVWVPTLCLVPWLTICKKNS